MSNVPGALEYQLKDISLSDGVNARDRQEVVDWTKYWTTLDNLVNDDDKCYVKRQGIVSVGTTDEASNPYGSVYRLLNARDSACVIGSKFNLWSYNTSTGKLIKKDQLPVSEFSSNVYPVDGNGKQGNLVILPGSGTGGTADGIGDTSGRVLDSCVSSKYSVVMRAAGTQTASNTSDPSDVIITITDRNTNDVVRRYSLSEGSLGGGNGAASFNDLDGMARCTFIDDRYLHIAYFASADQKIIQLDSNAFPANLSGSTFTVVNTLASATTGQKEGLVCLLPMAGKSVLVLYSNAGSNTLVYTFSTSSVLSTALSILTWAAGGGDTYSTNLWLVAVNATPKYEVKKIDCSVNPPSVTTTLTDGSIPNIVPSTTAPPPRIACHSDGSFVIVGWTYAATLTANVNCLVTQLIYSTGNNFFKGLGVIADWVPGAHPFCDRSTGRFYMPMIKLRRNAAAYTAGSALPQDDTGAFVVFELGATLTRPDGTGWYAGTGTPNYFHPFRPAANISPQYVARNVTNLNSLTTGGTQNPYYGEQVVQQTSDGTFFMAIEAKASSQSRIYWGIELKSLDPSGLSSAGELISGATVSTYDGSYVMETGFSDSPNVYLADSGIGGGPPAGSYNYVAVYDYTDGNGRVHFSRTSRVSSITTAAANKINVQVTCPAYSRADTLGIGIRIYRTISGGSDFFFLTSVQCPLPTSSLGGNSHFTTTFADTITDATLQTKPPLYRQPGQSNTPLDRYPFLASNFICRHKDRVFTAFYNTVYYSSFFVDGEAPWTNPQFAFPVYGGSGPITAIASMDGTLIIFKRDAIFVVDGDGPPENGGNGTEFSPPRRINTEFGCIDQRSVVATPDGILYRSQRGIEILTRSLQVEWAGLPVQNIVNGYTFLGGAAFDRNKGRAYFVLGSAKSGNILDPTKAGVVLTYDTESQSWYDYKMHNQTAYGNAMQDCIFIKLYNIGVNDPSHRMIWLSANEMHIQSPTLKTDNGNFIPFVMESGWIKIDSTQDRIRVSDLFVVAKSITNHKLKLSAAYDYSNTYTTIRTFTPDQIPSTLEQLQFQIPKGAKQSIRFKIEDAAPDDTTSYPIGNGNGPEIFGITIRLALRGGGAKLPAAQRA